MTLWAGEHQGKLPFCGVRWTKALWQWGYNFSLSHDLITSRDHIWCDFVQRSPSGKITITFDSHRHSDSGDILVYFLSRALGTRNQRVIWLYRQQSIKVNYHPAAFGGHRYCGSGYMMILVCHVILQDHVIKRSCDFMDRSPSRKVTILPSLVAIGTLVVEMLLVCHVILT